MKVVRIEPLSCDTQTPVYRGYTGDEKVLFVKDCGEEVLERVLQTLVAIGPCELVPNVVDAEVPALGGRHCLCQEWRDSERVLAEDMTDVQASSLLAGYLRFSTALQRPGVASKATPEDDPDRQYDIIADYAHRHPLVSRWLRPLLSIPAAERSYAAFRLSTIHGDFHSLNYGFSGERMSVIFDYDGLTLGLPSEDITHTVVQSLKGHLLSRRKRRRLLEIFRQLVRKSPWPVSEWKVAVNHARLRVAAHRIKRHPASPWTAFEVAWRDCPLSSLALI